MIDKTIVDHADPPGERVHPFSAQPATADVEYEAQIRDVLAWRERGQDRLDYVLLGMGADGHTASLFPHSPALHEAEHLVRINVYPAVKPPRRVTMTYPLLNSSRFIGILVTGASKASMIQRIAQGTDSPDELPIKGIVPLNGELKWYLDATACGIEKL